MASKGKPHRVVVVEGFEILIGKGDEENDRLTFETAAPQDLWLHVGAGIAGSHVVVRNPEKLDEIPKDVVRRAAELAAWHSKAREAGRVDVAVLGAPFDGAAVDPDGTHDVEVERHAGVAVDVVAGKCRPGGSYQGWPRARD